MTISTTIMRWLCCKHVGSDNCGNRYYLSRFKNAEGQYTRSVSYAKEKDPTTIPPQWHRWLHYTSTNIPLHDDIIYPWVQKKKPNMTGTLNAYYPPGHILHMEHRHHMEDHYEPWHPNRSSRDES